MCSVDIYNICIMGQTCWIVCNCNWVTTLLWILRNSLGSFSWTLSTLTVLFTTFRSKSTQLWKVSHTEITKGRSVGMQSWSCKGGMFLRESPALNCLQKIINWAIFVKDTLSSSDLYIQLSFHSTFSIVPQQLASCNTHLGKHTRSSSCPVCSLRNRWRSLALAEALLSLLFTARITRLCAD